MGNITHRKRKPTLISQNKDTHTHKNPENLNFGVGSDRKTESLQQSLYFMKYNLDTENITHKILRKNVYIDRKTYNKAQ